MILQLIMNYQAAIGRGSTWRVFVIVRHLGLKWKSDTLQEWAVLPRDNGEFVSTFE